MRKLIMLAVMGAGLTLAGTTDAEASSRYRWGGYGGYYGRPYYGYSYYSPRYYGYSHYSPRYYSYGYSPRYYSYGYSPRYYGGYGGYYGGYGYGSYPRSGFSLYLGRGGFSLGYNRFRW
jgi:hypothetical protein